MATVTVNGVNVPDGSSVNFSTDFGSFGQNGLPLVSVVTHGGVAVTALCGPSAGQAQSAPRRRSAAMPARPSSRSRSSPAATPFRSSPPAAPALVRGRHSPDAQWRPLLRERIHDPRPVHGQRRHQGRHRPVGHAEPDRRPDAGLPGILSPGLLAQVTGVSARTRRPRSCLSRPACFAYGTQDASTPQISSLLPSSGTSGRWMRVTIVGLGFLVGGGVQGLLRRARGHRRLGLLQPGRRPSRRSRSASRRPWR